MTFSVDLPDEAVRRLQAEASRRGVSVDEVIADLAENLSAGSLGSREAPAFVAVGASDRGITNRLEDLLADGFGRD